MDTVEEVADRVVIRDVFPAVVEVGTDSYRNARAVVTRDRVYVWLTRAAPVLDAAYDPASSSVAPINAPSSRASTLTLTSGVGVRIVGQRGCGCGNPLKGWTPWRPYRKGTV